MFVKKKTGAGKVNGGMVNSRLRREVRCAIDPMFILILKLALELSFYTVSIPI